MSSSQNERDVAVSKIAIREQDLGAGDFLWFILCYTGFLVWLPCIRYRIATYMKKTSSFARVVNAFLSIEQIIKILP